MLDFWTAVWWENTCSGLDRRTKADKCVQYWIGRFKKGDGRIAAGICSLASGCFWQESAVRLYSTCCTVHLIYWRFPKALKDIQDKTSFTDADAKSRAKNTEELHQAQFPSEDLRSSHFLVSGRFSVEGFEGWLPSIVRSWGTSRRGWVCLMLNWKISESLLRKCSRRRVSLFEHRLSRIQKLDAGFRN